MTETHGANSIPKIAEPFIAEIERLNADIESMRGEYMQRCKAPRAAIQEVYHEAKEKGVAKRPLKLWVRELREKRKIAKIASDFDIDESATYSALRETLGPLGQAAAIRAGYGTDNAPVRVDGDINKLGRGPLDQQNPVDALA